MHWLQQILALNKHCTTHSHLCNLSVQCLLSLLVVSKRNTMRLFILPLLCDLKTHLIRSRAMLCRRNRAPGPNT
jgi:hypothetical protein